MSNHASKINFFIVGAAKGGTTTVFDCLNSREDVYLSPLKEPNYYSTDIDTSSFSTEFCANTNLDLTSYFSQDPLPVKQIGFIRDFTLYDRLFAAAPETAKLIGECSTSYLYSTVAAEKIQAAHPDAKILIMLRHPVDRLYSHYMMARKYGFTSLPLIDAVKKDMSHPKPGWGSSEIFVDLGLYTDQIARYKAHFPASQIRIMFTRDLRSEEKWSELLEWLGLPNTQTEILERSDANTAGLAKFEGLNRALTSSGLKKKLGALIPANIKKSLVKWYYSDEGLPKITEEERLFLMEIYEDELERLKSEHRISF
jgi:hypothetical protein